MCTLINHDAVSLKPTHQHLYAYTLSMDSMPRPAKELAQSPVSLLQE
jgi:hypothetical protein